MLRMIRIAILLVGLAALSVLGWNTYGNLTRSAEYTAHEQTDLWPGTGPWAEAQLKKINVLRYDQIAAFSDDDLTNLDEALNLQGRAEREDWVGQAQRLMAEAAAEEVPPEEEEAADSNIEKAG